MLDFYVRRGFMNCPNCGRKLHNMKCRTCKKQYKTSATSPNRNNFFVSKDRFSQLKKDSGFFGKIESISCSKIHGIKPMVNGSIELRKNGLFFNQSFGLKGYCSISQIKKVDVTTTSLVLNAMLDGKIRQVVGETNNIDRLISLYKHLCTTIKQEVDVEFCRQYEEIKRREQEKKERMKAEKKLSKKELEKERLKQLKENKIAFCPKCHSTSLTFYEKKRTVSGAVIGGTLGAAVTASTGGLGAVAGAALGSKMGNKGRIKCLNCGHTWKS